MTDLTTLTEEELLALRDDIQRQLLELYDQGAAIHRERTARKVAAQIAAKQAQITQSQAELEAMQK